MSIRFRPGASILNDVCDGLDEYTRVQPLEVGEVRCSFCKRATQRFTATFGQGPIKKSISPDVRDGQRPTMKITHFASTVVACPDCSLQVRTGLKWPEDRG